SGASRLPRATALRARDESLGQRIGITPKNHAYSRVDNGLRWLEPQLADSHTVGLMSKLFYLIRRLRHLFKGEGNYCARPNPARACRQVGLLINVTRRGCIDARLRTRVDAVFGNVHMIA